eukprot:836503_1
MLYKKITSIALSAYAFLSSPNCGGTYYLSSNLTNPFYCSPQEECKIICDVEDYKTPHEYHCANATECIFECETKRCYEDATLYGENALNLNCNTLPTNRDSDSCFHSAVVYAPDNGSANFTNGALANQIYTRMTIISGNHTQEIILDCSEDCQKIDVDARTAQFLGIDITEGKFSDSTVQCPVNSQYTGPELSPCIIDVANSDMKQVEIYAPDGIPKGVWITDCGQCDTMDVEIHCSIGDDLWPFNASSNCWRTGDPSTYHTIDPTIYTTIPSSSPSIFPTPLPSMMPTEIPTVIPTQSPSFDPPTQSPLLVPTRTPSDVPVTENVRTVDSTMMSTSHGNEGSDTQQLNWAMWGYFPYFVVGAVVLLIIAILCTCVVLYRMKLKEARDAQNMTQMIDVQVDVVPQVDSLLVMEQSAGKIEEDVKDKEDVGDDCVKDKEDVQQANDNQNEDDKDDSMESMYDVVEEPETTTTSGQPTQGEHKTN